MENEKNDERIQEVEDIIQESEDEIQRNEEELISNYKKKKTELGSYRITQAIFYCSAILGLYGTVHSSVACYKLVTMNPPYESEIELMNENGWKNTTNITAYSKENEHGTIVFDGNTVNVVLCENDDNKPMEICTPMSEENLKNLQKVLLPNYAYTYNVSPDIKTKEILIMILQAFFLTVAGANGIAIRKNKQNMKEELEEYKNAKKLLKEYNKR